jgi:hypothetical protein
MTVLRDVAKGKQGFCCRGERGPRRFRGVQWRRKCGGSSPSAQNDNFKRAGLGMTASRGLRSGSAGWEGSKEVCGGSTAEILTLRWGFGVG